MNSGDRHFAASFHDWFFTGLLSLFVDPGPHSGDGPTGHSLSLFEFRQPGESSAVVEGRVR